VNDFGMQVIWPSVSGLLCLWGQVWFAGSPYDWFCW